MAITNRLREEINEILASCEEEEPRGWFFSTGITIAFLVTAGIICIIVDSVLLH
jgi:hypothetical protein